MASRRSGGNMFWLVSAIGLTGVVIYQIDENLPLTQPVVLHPMLHPLMTGSERNPIWPHFRQTHWWMRLPAVPFSQHHDVRRP